MSEQFKYIRLDQLDKFTAKLRPDRLNAGSNPRLSRLLSVMDSPSRICAVESIEDLIELTDVYEKHFNPGDMAVILDTYTGIARMFIWIDKSIKWQEVDFGSGGGVEPGSGLTEDQKALLALIQTVLPTHANESNQLATLADISMSSGGIQFKGVFNSYVQLTTLGQPSAGWLVSVLQDEQDGFNRSMYIHNGTTWVRLTSKSWQSSGTEPSDKNALWVDISGTYPELKWHDGSKWVSLGGSGSADRAKRIQSFQADTYYSFGELVVYNNRLYSSRISFTSGQLFNEMDWEIVGGDMRRSVYDTNYNGIVDRAEMADIAQMALETTLVQSWRPNTPYVTGQQLVYLGKIYTVRQNHLSGASFNINFLDLTATGIHNDLWELQGGETSRNEFYHLNRDNYEINTKLKDNFGRLYYNNFALGDMLKSVYDTNNNGIIDRAATLAGLTTSVDELNLVKGSRTNLQEQIDAVTTGMVFKGFAPSFDQLTVLFPIPSKGDTVIIESDETKNNMKTFYTHSGTEWIYLGPFEAQVRDFSLYPLNLSTEATGIISAANIDPAIARLTDVHTHNNLPLLETYTNSNIEITDAISRRHSHNNKALLDSYTNTNTDLSDAVSRKHSHTNMTLINHFAEDTFGRLLYKGDLVGSGGTGGGISDLSMFTTNDLRDSYNKRYVTDTEKSNIALLPGVISDQSIISTHINTINSKIPTDATPTNKLISEGALNLKLNSLRFTNLVDTPSTITPNSFVVTNANGSAISYRATIDSLIKIQKVTDMDGTVFSGIPFLKLNSLKGVHLPDGTLELSTPDLFSTSLKDMPTTYQNGSVLISNANTMKYELKQLSDVTDSKANYTNLIQTTDWTTDPNLNKEVRLVNHGLDSRNLIVAFYDNNSNYIFRDYRILDNNTIMVYSAIKEELRVVINCSQGTVNLGGTGGTGGTGSVSALELIDDSRSRLDRTYSSQKVVSLLLDYAKRTNVYSRSESDARFALKGNEHNHTNLTVLDRLTANHSGEVFYDGKKLLTNVTPFFYQQHWNSVEKNDLDVILNIATVMSDQGYTAVSNSEFTVKNIIESSLDDIVNEANTLHLVVSDGAIILLDVKILPGETQRYVLGISPNVRVMVKGKFNANYYLNAF